MMERALHVYSKGEFSVRTTQDADGTMWFVGKDIAQCLEYSDASVSQPNNLFSAVPEVWKGYKRIMTPGGEQNMTCLTEQGVYFFLGRSDKAKALPYQMWIAGEVVPSLRATGSYSVKGTQNHEGHDARMKELEMYRRELDLRGAQILQSLIDKELFPITPETRTVFAHEVFKLVTGHEYLGMLPESTEKWYTATEIGSVVGLSANKVGRIAKANGLKAPEGGMNEYGRWIFSKSRYSSREVPSFIYTETALEWFKDYQRGDA